MVGALADWFAVGRTVSPRAGPVYLAPYGELFRANKDRIGDNLGQFVQEKFSRYAVPGGADPPL